MKDKINIAEVLKDCPQGMELDCTMYDNLYFDSLNADYYGTINCYTLIDGIKTSINFTKYGTFNNHIGAKCVIFPKGKTTWEGFQRPFKDEDIVFTNTGEHDWISIFKRFSENMCCTYIDLCINDDDLITGTGCLCSIEYIKTQRLATEEEKVKLFEVIKDRGYKWNTETKTLEKLVEPKFKVGDRITLKNCNDGKPIYKITKVKNDCYETDQGELPFYYEDSWKLVPNKFDINTLVPFESKVLVRNDEHQYWIPAFWGCKRADGYTTTFGWCKYCIPYDGNEHLLETNNDCNEYYKTWK